MNKIALTAAAILVATSAAFAGSDNFGSNNVNQPAVTATAPAASTGIDRTITGSIQKFEQRDLKITPDQNQPQSGQGIWGR
ncbi:MULTISPECIES: DUF680 domain-containing protein [unclassified Mesorhizobium]|uniref:DUF680 domain-containing protein n=1 Tax=unclassified Mesorhizobium TaxID=325217 RepID=UPI00096174D9|nr:MULTISPECIES: DUF680 domain-containing protein [unclassified Mesorhizobium]MBN9256633.1 DUF680 domain-containing protein [Mesorhizobium sp.]MBN9268695.1 DUF680 domain-containing protein [Mesorhizobium sp.]OJX83083.1 MAG: hypothetical protein BGO93_20160 [Mesorhizobium sp. 65-26]